MGRVMEVKEDLKKYNKMNKIFCCFKILLFNNPERKTTNYKINIFVVVGLILENSNFKPYYNKTTKKYTY